MPRSSTLESRQEDIINVGSFGLENHSSLSDVEIIEQFGTKNHSDNVCESSTPHLDKITHVHFEDLSAYDREQNASKKVRILSSTNTDRECMVEPNQLGTGCGGGDERELLRATSEGKQVHRNSMYCQLYK